MTVKIIDIREEDASTVLKKSFGGEAPVEVARRVTAATLEEILSSAGKKRHGVDILWY